ncbi:MAG: endonuclease/exonuclease/phosphatase family protein [Bacteroidota bacterium]
MKIITWNCNMAFRKKAAVVLALQPDILIIPECEHPDKLLFPVNMPAPKDIVWFGKNRNKGLGIFSYSEYRFKVLRNHNENLQMIIPISVTGGEFNFNLFAIWANNPTDKDGQYVEQVWKAIHHYENLLTDTKTMLTGDFNSNTIWDRKRRAGNHSNVVNFLAQKGIRSAYHLLHEQVQGSEQHPTHYLYRHENKPYHLDYCFVSADIANSLQSVEIGDYHCWAKYSDHMPIIVTFDNPSKIKSTRKRKA